MQAKLSHMEIMDVLKNDKAFLRKEFGVINISLSYALYHPHLKFCTFCTNVFVINLRPAACLKS